MTADGREVGEMRSSRDGLGLALLRHRTGARGQDARGRVKPSRPGQTRLDAAGKRHFALIQSSTNYIALSTGGAAPAFRTSEPSPLMREGWEEVTNSRNSSRDIKKHPVDGAQARARTLRHNMTEAERRVWQILRSHRMTGYQFRRQVPIGRYIADFVCPTLCARGVRLIVEIDGGQHDRSSPRRRASRSPRCAASPPTQPSPFTGKGFSR